MDSNDISDVGPGSPEPISGIDPGAPKPAMGQPAGGAGIEIIENPHWSKFIGYIGLIASHL